MTYTLHNHITQCMYILLFCFYTFVFCGLLISRLYEKCIRLYIHLLTFLPSRLIIQLFFENTLIAALLFASAH